MLRTCLLFFCMSVLLRAETCACTIPVFRYALDRWEADHFHLVLPTSSIKDGPLNDALRPLRANGKANMDITINPNAAASQTELRYSRESERLVWNGVMDQAMLETLLDSPGRRQILERILAGDSAIWVIADAGTAEDNADFSRIKKRLAFLEQVASLPIQDPNDPDSQLGPGPALRLKFSMLRLRRDDPAEKVLLNMLVGPRGIVEASTTSFVATIFGKGRVLGAWPLADVDDASLEDTAMFLVGRCSCRLKNENPGWDLLLNVDWEKALAQADKKHVEVIAEKPAPVTTQAVVTSAIKEAAEPVRTKNSVLIGGAALLLIAAILMLRGSFKK